MKSFLIFSGPAQEKKKVKQMTLNLHTANSNYRQDFKVALFTFKPDGCFLLALHGDLLYCRCKM